MIYTYTYCIVNLQHGINQSSSVATCQHVATKTKQIYDICVWTWSLSPSRIQLPDCFDSYRFQLYNWLMQVAYSSFQFDCFFPILKSRTPYPANTKNKHWTKIGSEVHPNKGSKQSKLPNCTSRIWDFFAMARNPQGQPGAHPLDPSKCLPIRHESRRRRGATSKRFGSSMCFFAIACYNKSWRTNPCWCFMPESWWKFRVPL